MGINSLFPKFEIGLISEDPDGTGELTYQWQSSTDKKTWDDISTESAYSVQADDEGKSVRSIISYKDNQGFDEEHVTPFKSIPFVDDGNTEFSISGTVLVGKL